MKQNSNSSSLRGLLKLCSLTMRTQIGMQQGGRERCSNQHHQQQMQCTVVRRSMGLSERHDTAAVGEMRDLPGLYPGGGHSGAVGM